MTPVVEVTNLTKHYGDITALSELSLTIDGGEIFALIGPNGAGKTTFVRAITGSLAPTAGTIRVFGEDPRNARTTRIGLLPQSFSPPERLTGREIITYYAGLYDTARSVDSVLRDVGMENDADRWYERLSGGQQRRICVGTTLVNDPELLILDEPTTGIDPAGRRQLWSLFEGLRRSGRTLVLTTHDMAEAERLGDRVGLLDDGELITVGSPAELTARHGDRGTMTVEPIDADVDSLREGLDRPVVERNGVYLIDGIEPDEIGAVIAQLDRANLAFRRVAWESPSLEDVFLTVTEGER